MTGTGTSSSPTQATTESSNTPSLAPVRTSATGTTVAGVGGDGSGANQLNYPNALALDSKGDLFISDEDNSRVLEYTLNNVSGAYSATGTTRASVGGPVALDSHGDLFVGDPSHNRVLEYTLNTSNGTYSTSGTVVAKLGASGSGAIAAGPGTILVDSAGNIFAGGGFYTDDVVEFPISSSGKYPSSPTVLLNGPGAGPSQVAFVWGLAVDSHGDLFIADTQNQRIQELVGIAATSTPPPPPPPSAPVVTGVTPATGPAAGGTPVTVSGSNLSGASVSFGSAAATGVSCSASSCAATSPSGTGTVNVTVTNSGGTSATSSADQFTYQAAAPPPPPPGNLIPDPGFESSGVPADNWGSSLSRSQAVVHSGSWSLAQTANSSSGGWDLDSNPSWYAPISSATTFTASIWVLSPATVKVDLNVDLLNSSGGYVKQRERSDRHARRQHLGPVDDHGHSSDRERDSTQAWNRTSPGPRRERSSTGMTCHSPARNGETGLAAEPASPARCSVSSRTRRAPCLRAARARHPSSAPAPRTASGRGGRGARG